MLALGNKIGVQHGSGDSFSSYWTTLISAVIEDASPTHLILTFPSPRTILTTDLSVSDNTVESLSWSGNVCTVVLGIEVIYGNIPTVNFKSLGAKAITNNVILKLALTASFVATQITLKLNCTVGKSIHVDWGDGTSNDYNGTVSTSFTAMSNYLGQGTYPIKITGDVNEITYIQIINQTSVSGDISPIKYCTKIATFQTYGSPGIIGDITHFDNLTSLTNLNASHAVAGGLSGNLSGLRNSPITFCGLSKNSGIYGDIAHLNKPAITTINLRENSRLSCSAFIPAGVTWKNITMTLTSCLIDTVSLDNLLNSISLAVTGASTGSINFTGVLEHRSPVSNDAVTNLTNNSFALTAIGAVHTVAYINSASKEIIPLITPEGSGYTVHPSVIGLETEVSGYKNWMVNTPYPDNVAITEVPCIYASNTYNNFVVPSGVTNPILANPASGHYADTDIIRHNGKFYVVFYEFNSLLSDYTGHEAISLLESVDGISWEYKGPIFSADDEISETRLVCPTIVHDGTLFHVCYIDLNADAWIIRHRTAASIYGPYTDAQSTTGLTKLPNREWWHFGLYYESGVFYIVMNANSGGLQSSAPGPYIYAGKSLNCIDFIRSDFATVYVTESYATGFYRPKIAKINGVYKLYYTYQRADNTQYQIAVCDIYLV